MKVAVIGANGQLGSDLLRAFSGGEAIPLTHADIEIVSSQEVEKVLAGISPQVVINTAAFHRVEDCEEEYIKAFQVNAIGPRNLARSCQRLGATLVHISTDYIFDGKNPPKADSGGYLEEDRPNPLNTYGLTKLASEYYVRNLCSKHFIVRTSALYGMAKCRAKGENFIDTMLRLAKEKPEIKVVDDVITAPTYTWDLARKIRELIELEQPLNPGALKPLNLYGVYHITNSGQCSWYDFAEKIFGLEGLSVDLKRVSQKEFHSKVMRPNYSVLENGHLKALGLEPLRPWHEALAEYMAERWRRPVVQEVS